MDDRQWYADLAVIGELSDSQQLAKLLELYGDDAPAALRRGDLTEERVQPWQHTSHKFGYIRPAAKGRVEIENATEIEPDPTLAGQAVNLRLDRLRVARYPGGAGMHHVLIGFSGKNVTGDASEQLHFAQTFLAQDGEAVGVMGYPIFRSLNVGATGLDFQCGTVNVKNRSDETLLSFLDSDTFKSGLGLLTTAQPALAPLAGVVLGLVKQAATRHRNVPVQTIALGLTMTTVPTQAKLREGAYVAIQSPEDFSLADWVYDTSRQTIVHRKDSTLIGLNYIIFSLTRK